MVSNRRIVLVLLVVALIGAAATASLYVLTLEKGTQSTSGQNTYPPGCTKPAGPDGFLLIASHLGWNDSELEGAGVTPGVVWPKMTVTEGSTVDITVCNTDVQTHSFNMATYLDTPINTIAPQQVLHFSFVADQAGTFQVFCEVPCSIHIYMLSGQLIVTPS